MSIKSFRCQQRCQRRLQQRQLRQKLLLQSLSHKERLDLVSRHNFLGRSCIGMGSLFLATLVVGIVDNVPWLETAEVPEVALISWVLGMGLGSSLVLVFGESSRHFQCATEIQVIDEELQETATVSTEEDAELIESYYDVEYGDCDDDDDDSEDGHDDEKHEDKYQDHDSDDIDGCNFNREEQV